MKTIYIKKPFKGMVAIRDKILNEAKKDRMGLIIHCAEKKMTIPYEKLDSYWSISETKFQDHFSEEKHKLVYYGFRPDEDVEKVIERQKQLF